ncbi:putative leucine-rich repeat-containing protein DDB_G0290503 [Linepithema humile]|uniref:putative leucine-rich repeat-containing protein DDB_G0290503 n=1 Tax=Linepithema humile TaxID=83485 RepID=UPI00351E1011
MSFTNELNIYGGMMAEGMVMKASLMEEQSEQCLTLIKQEHVADKLVIGEEIVVGTNGYLPDKVDNQTDATVYFEQNLEDSKISIKYEEISSAPLTENLISENWECEDVGAASPLKENELDGEEDEETIATFITAKGEQLALYAVENFDEMFAVAVYDESGKPPNDFQFLTKTDVERLINEGAVQTVKKPTQMKRRLVTTQPQLFYHKEDFEGLSEQAEDKASILNTIDSEKSARQEENCTIEQDYQSHQNFNSLEINSTSNDLLYSTADTQSNITYLMMDDDSANIADVGDGENRELNESEDNRVSESELMEQSTVQYIFFEDEQQSDSELTFDEIQTTLQNLKTSREKVSEKEKSEQDIHSSDTIKQDAILHDSTPLKSLNKNFSSSLSSVTNNLTRVSATDDKFENERQRLIDTLTDSPPPPPLPSSSSSSLTSLSSTLQLKVKRSRKQQLILVNRDDGEIIFQPPLLQNEDEMIGKKRGKQRRRTPSQMRRGFIDAKRMKRTRQREVEVIELDVDEEEQQAKRNIVEITLDDSTDKYSSDKENDIIMVRDSDSDNGDDEREEEEEDRLSSKLSRLMRCEHCSRNFRQRRALETHLRVCQKSPENALRLNDEKGKVQMDKQYPCKICQEKFDVVVALARHVRVAHSLRKKHKLRFVSPKTPNKSLGSVQKETSSTEEEELAHRGDTAKRELSMLARVKRKRRKRSNYTWEKNNLTCTDCGKLFLSTTLLNAHVLQHGTKKSEQRLRKCHICQQLIRSKFLFLRHLRMHSETQSSSDNNLKLLQRKLRARSNPHKIAVSRKRGRPRKF